MVIGWLGNELCSAGSGLDVLPMKLVRAENISTMLTEVVDKDITGDLIGIGIVLFLSFGA